MLTPIALTGLALSGAGIAGLTARAVTRRIAREHPPAAEFVDVDGVPLHLRITGDRSRPPVLVLHGAASNLEEPHLALAATFGDEHTIWLDRPGLGWSERPGGDWSPEREAALIARLIETLDLPPVCVIGHSWGGAIAMRLTLDHPQHIAGQVLVAPALSAWIGEAAWFNKASFWPLLGPVMTRLVVPLVGEAQLVTGAAKAFDPEPVPADYARASNLPLLLRHDVWLANAADMARVNQHLEAQEDLYETIEKPTILLAGLADTVLWTKKHAVAVSKRMPAADLRIVEGAGHNLHHHHPERVLEAVADIRTRAVQLTNPVQSADATA